MRRRSAWPIVALALWLAAGCQPHGLNALRRGDELRRSGRLVEAVPLLLHATTDLPNEPRAWNFLGMAYQASGHTLEAQRAYLQALKEDRNFTDAHFNLGLLFADQSEWLEVERSFRAFLAVETNQSQAIAWRYLGEAQWHNHAFDAAQRSLAFAAKLDGRNPDVWNLLGVVEAARRHFPEAKQNLSYAHYLDPRHPAALFNLAVLTQQQLGDRKAAATLFREFLTVAPLAPNAESVRSLIRQLEASPPVPAPVEPRKSADGSRPSNLNVAVHPIVPELPLVSQASPVSPHPPPLVTNMPSARPVQESASTSIAPIRIDRIANLQSTSYPPPRSIGISNLKAVIPPATMSSPPVVSAHESSGTLVSRTNNRDDTFILPPPDVVKINDGPELSAAPALPPPPRSSEFRPPAIASAATSASQVSQPIIRTVDPHPTLSPTRPISSGGPTSNQNDQKAGLWTRLNPVRWGNPRRWFSDSSEKEPTYVADGPSPAPIPPPAKLTATVVLPPKIRRYQRAYPDGLTPGDRSAAEARFIAGADAWDAGDRQTAVNAYRQAIIADPTYFPAQYNLALAAMAVGDVATALQAGEASSIADPLSSSAHRAFGTALARGSFPADAAEELEKFLQLQPSDADGHLAIAGIYANQLNDPVRARYHYERVLVLRPQHPQLAQIQAWLANR